MTWSLHPGAEQDIAGILDFYSERAGAIVAKRFLVEFERVADLWSSIQVSERPPPADAEHFLCESFRTRSCTGRASLEFSYWWSAISIESRISAAPDADPRVECVVRPRLRIA